MLMGDKRGIEQVRKIREEKKVGQEGKWRRER